MTGSGIGGRRITYALVCYSAIPAFDTLYARHLDRGSTGQEYGLWEASYFITGGIGAVIGGFLVTLYRFNGVFVGMALLAFLAASYIYFLPKNRL